MQEPQTFKALTNGDNLVDEVTALYEDLRDPLLRFAAFKNLGDTSCHEDLVQDVFVELIGQVRSGSIIQNPKAWLFKAIHSRGIDGIRKVRRRATHLQLLPISTNEGTPGIQQRLELADVLEHALGRLNGKQRDVLMLLYIGELSYNEIAYALDISFEQVSVYRARALRKLRIA